MLKYIKEAVLGKKTLSYFIVIILTDEQISRSDLNGDGYIDFIDAQIILKYDAGLIDTL